MDKMRMETKDITAENVERIGEMFQNVVTEVKDPVTKKLKTVIDFDVLRQMLSDEIVEGGSERYNFTWPGKKEAMIEANRPIRKTLRPCKEESKNWDTTENLYIEGDNLEVLKILQESYLGSVKMIYIDPPYNTGNDFIYKDDFKMSNKEFTSDSGAVDSEGNRMIQNTESNGRFHSDWCSMFYSRLLIAKNLLTKDGAIFISIDDNENGNVQKICDEIFGESNFIANLIWKSKSGGANDSKFFAIDHEYVLVYAKDINYVQIKIDKEAVVTTSYNNKDENGEYALDRLDKQSIRYSKSLDYEIIGPDGTIYKPKHKDSQHPNATWRWGKDTVEKRYSELVFKDGNIYTKNYQKEGSIARSLLIEDRFGRTRTGKTDCFTLFNQELFSNPKPVKLIRYLQTIIVDDDSIVLDFFSGSGTTAHSVMQLNAENEAHIKYIMIQLPELCSEGTEAKKAGYDTISDIGKERIRRAGEQIGKGDVGFRVFKVDSTNMKDVYYSVQDYSQSMLEGTVDNIKNDRNDLDLLYGVLLEMGLKLSSPQTTEVVFNKKIHIVYSENAIDLIACFESNVNESVIRNIAKRQPVYAVFRDSSFSASPDKINLEEIFKMESPGTTIKVI